MGGKQVFIHAGAHRTGTSSFQMCLAINRAVLEAAGFDPAYPGRDGAPGGRLALRLPQPRHGADKAQDMADRGRKDLAGLSPDDGRKLLISEENIPGRMYHFYAGKFFPAAPARLGVLARALPGKVAHLLYVIRPYDELFVSAYRKRAEDNPVPPFADIAGTMAGFAGGWPELLGAMQEALAPGRISVIGYGNRGESRALLARLAGLDPLALREPARELNVSATDAALAVLQARYAAGEKLKRKAWQAVIAAHADDRADRGFARFAPAQAARLRRRYERDLDRIAGMAGITLEA